MVNCITLQPGLSLYIKRFGQHICVRYCHLLCFSLAFSKLNQIIIVLLFHHTAGRNSLASVVKFGLFSLIYCNVIDTILLCYKQVTEMCSWVPVFCPYNKTWSINTTKYNHLCLKWVSTICHKHIRIVSLQVIISLSGRKLLSKVLFPGISNKFSIHLYLVGCDREISQCVINNCIGLSLTS